MQIKRIPFPQVPQLSSKDVAYAEQDPALRPFFKYEVNLEAFSQVIEDKKKDAIDRNTLVKVLKSQYAQLETTEIIEKNIEALLDKETFTVTTAHQPSLFTGPLYFIYKIISTLNLAGQLNRRYPNQYFVPVFITGGEDHDFEEINHANLFNKTIIWENEESGAVGQMKTSSLSSALAELKEILGESDKAREAYALIEGAYTRHKTYGMATVHLVNELFKSDGLIVLNPNHPELKRLFRPFIEKEIVEQVSKEFVESTTLKLEKAGFSGQAYAREINFFYLRDQIRERIVQNGSGYEVLNTDYKFSESELKTEIQNHPERFSPNVIMRPLYQELILPNLAYIGGGGELAYWLERKTQFEFFGLNFPMLIRRNSVLWVDKGGAKRLEKLGMDIEEFFPDVEDIIKSYVKKNTENELNLNQEKKALNDLFDSVNSKAISIDPTLGKTVLAEKSKQLKLLEQLESRLMRAEKQRHDIAINQIRTLKEKYFPGNGLQERKDNFLGPYLQSGETFFETLKAHLNPLDKGFIILIDN